MDRRTPPGLVERVGPRELRLHPCDEADFPSREPNEGFSLGSTPETIFLGEGPITVECPDPLRFEIQPGVPAAQLEREQRFTKRKRSYTARRPSVSRLPKGIVDTECFLTCPDEYHYLTDSLRGHRITEWFGYEVLPDWTQVREVKSIAERDERVVVLGAQNNDNYSHWLLESVARAALFQPFDDGTWLFLTPPLVPWQRRMLEFAGVSCNRIMELEPSGLIRFAEVVAVTRGLGRIQELNPAVLDVLASLAPRVRRRRRLYISRAHTKVRRVSNEAALIEFFEGHGFETVHPQLLTIEEQVELFAGAEIVAGVHGSGNSGVIFSAPATLVIELQSGGFDKGGIEYLWNLCAARGHRFVQVLCAHAAGTEGIPDTHRDITVDLPHLAATLSPLL
ncbi:MAG TPA: glycosyltransferase 61 family protein [Solirubrobacteraceae bacterium]|jgi:hypothetical protein|nr:glycosyltransferase 61 family protein [Solirubrobacteraceae bacterium]